MPRINPVFTALLFLLSRLCHSEPSLVIPLGSYMERVHLMALHISENKLHYSKGSAPIDPVSLECWQAGNDIYFSRDESYLGCDTSITRNVENAARYLYSTLIPYGSYLQGCFGLLKVPESVDNSTRYYLYASCRRIDNGERFFQPQKVDITDCPPGHLVNHNGYLACAESAEPRRQMVSGSYLTSGCDVADSYYTPSLDQIKARCQGTILTITGVKSAIDSGKDVVYQNQSLEFAFTAQGAAAIHEASLYLPPGNYTLSCRNAVFFPCMGQAGKGLLVAKCLTEGSPAMIPLRIYKSAFLEGADDQCAMHNMGYVSNINGELVCDPDIEFNYEENPTEAGLLEHLQCPTPK